MPVSQSVSTQLDVINQAVRNIGDRPFLLNDPVTNFREQCRFAVKTALFNFERDFDWLFARRYTNALSWNNEEAKIPNYTRLSYVHFKHENNFRYELRELRLEDLRQFALYPIQPLTVTAYPLYYAQQDSESIIVTPYPTTALDRAKVWFAYYAQLKRPASDTDRFDIPEDHIPLFVHKLAVELALVHLSDPDSIGTLKAAYDESKRLAISRQQGVSIGKSNMFRGSRGNGSIWY